MVQHFPITVTTNTLPKVSLLLQFPTSWFSTYGKTQQTQSSWIQRSWDWGHNLGDPSPAPLERLQSWQGLVCLYSMTRGAQFCKRQEPKVRQRKNQTKGPIKGCQVSPQHGLRSSKGIIPLHYLPWSWETRVPQPRWCHGVNKWRKQEMVSFFLQEILWLNFLNRFQLLHSEKIVLF